MPDAKYKVYLSKKLQKRLENISEPAGVLSGWIKDSSYTCVDCAANDEYFLPGLKSVGFFCCLESLPENEKDFLSACKLHIADKTHENDCLVIFVYPDPIGDSSSKIGLVTKMYSPYYCSIEDVVLSETCADLSDILLLRVVGEIPLMFEGSKDTELQEENLRLAIDRLRTVICSNMLVFQAKDSDIFFKNNSGYEDFLKVMCKDFLKDLLVSDDIDKSQRKLRKLRDDKIPVQFQMLLQSTSQVAIENNVNHSLVIHCQRRDFSCVSSVLPMDVLIVTQKTSSMEEVYNQLKTAISEQLDKFQNCLLDLSQGSKFPTLEVCYFHPSESEFPVTVIYQVECSDDQLEETRKSIHSSLLFPCDRPLFRKINRHLLSDTLNARGCLINPHIGLSSSGVQDGITAIVYGKYAYHHYMQDQINDDGWGCAYRSLQTIVSWFRLQGYTNKNIPSHKEIQQTLVKIGDKPASFVGSRKWIGSQEVAFCLDDLLGVKSRILHASSGLELASKGRELAHHFQNHGTPIMIGGGVLAHTILGIDFNPKSGDVKFLILDPHYTGGEDLSVIQNKGWCGWKKLDFWDQNAFYNLCLPQRPLIF